MTTSMHHQQVLSLVRGRFCELLSSRDGAHAKQKDYENISPPPEKAEAFYLRHWLLTMRSIRVADLKEPRDCLPGKGALEQGMGTAYATRETALCDRGDRMAAQAPTAAGWLVFGANDLRAPDQPQDRQGPRPDDPAVAAGAGGSGHRVKHGRGKAQRGEAKVPEGQEPDAGSSARCCKADHRRTHPVAIRPTHDPGRVRPRPRYPALRPTTCSTVPTASNIVRLGFTLTFIATSTPNTDRTRTKTRRAPGP
jgi:hypothetical protein